MPETKQTALILEGGALRGVYTSGVLDVLMLHHVKIPNVVGISAGSLNGLFYVSGQIGNAAELNLNCEYPSGGLSSFKSPLGRIII